MGNKLSYGARIALRVIKREIGTGSCITQKCLEDVCNLTKAVISALESEGVLRYRGRKAYALGWTALDYLNKGESTESAYIV